jgi:hypothetical protein
MFSGEEARWDFGLHVWHRLYLVLFSSDGVPACCTYILLCLGAFSTAVANILAF